MANSGYNVSDEAYKKINATSHYIFDHKDEVSKTLEVAEVDTIPGKDFVLVFYRYSIGVEIVHLSEYMKKIDGKYFLYLKYFSSYEDDPFKNDRGEEGKALLITPHPFFDQCLSQETRATSAISQVFEAPGRYSGDLEVVRLTY